MSRKATNIALLLALFAISASTAWAQKAKKLSCQSNEDECSAGVCKDCPDEVAAKFKVGANCKFAKAAKFKFGKDCRCDASSSITKDSLFKCDPNCDCAGVQCKCGPNCRCAEDAAAHVAALQRQLVEAISGNAVLEARLQAHEELAQFREEFAERMLAKETEVAHLHAQLQLAGERKHMSQEIAEAMAENAKLKASVELAHERHELMKQFVSANKSNAAEGLTPALLKSKAENAKLIKKVVELEKQLETLRVRLANKPGQDGIE